MFFHGELMRGRETSVKSIFLAALEINSAAERDKYVSTACGDDRVLRKEVQRLIDHHAKADSFLESPAAECALRATIDQAVASQPGRQVGGYRIREQIGEGGMGVVYVAEQERPLRRKVALKVIRPGMDSRVVLGRFEAERNALALMNHPNIAKVLDAGTTDEGRPFFAMELVNGIPITEYCDDQRLPIRDRLRLFLAVCSAIQHAHQKGIIHRDIKPSNVLVTELDGKPIAKVIDFGVAKALNQSLTEQTVYTAFQTVIGTPLYMSPEQASFSAADVDTRSDVYSLGVLMYELLTGSTPLTNEDFRQAAQEEVFKLIREREPPRPSNRISSLGEPGTRVSQLRCTQPEQLSRTVKGDLDWIVMKALSKERSRRYDSAAQLGEDVQHHLNNELVHARPPSLGYQLAKLYQRNRSLVAMVGLVIMSLSIGLGSAVWAYVRQVRLVQDRDRMLDELRDSRAEKILELVLSGELEQASDEVARFAETFPTGSEDRRLQLCRAVIRSFGSDQDRIEAREELRILNQRSGDLETRSLLVASYTGTGSEWDYFRSVSQLHDYQPSSFEEFLFRGYAYTFGMHDRALDDLENAVRLKRSSGVAHALLARALHLESLRSRDKSVGRKLAERAVEEAELATKILRPGSTLALYSRLDAYTGIIELAANGVGFDDQQKRGFQKKLKSNLDASFSRPYDWRLHVSQLDSLKILERYKINVKDSVRDRILDIPEQESIAAEVIVKAIQQYYRRNDLETCADLCSSYHSSINGFADAAFLPQIEFQLGSGVDLEWIKQQATARAVSRSGADDGITGMADWVLLSLLGEHDLAEDRGEAWLSFCRNNQLGIPIAKQLLPVAERVSGIRVRSNERVLSLIDDPQASMHAAFLLGVDELSRCNRPEAKRLFELAARSPGYHQFDSEWARLFLERVDDPTWLWWLEPKTEAFESRASVD